MLQKTGARKTKIRLDAFLVQNDIVESRNRAQEMIERGMVFCNGILMRKASQLISPGDNISVKGELQYVSRAGEKLACALDAFLVDPRGMKCLDIGSSTGGFTDCLLKRGAKHVVAVDVGNDQLHMKLRGDSRVELHENTDIRNFTPYETFDLLVLDLSFISLTSVIPVLARFMHTDSIVICLIKPQFEVGKEYIGKNGVVRPNAPLDRVFSSIAESFSSIDCILKEDYIDSPILGGSGNKEYLGCFFYNGV